MFKLRSFSKIVHYLHLYQKGLLHGEFLIMFIKETARSIKNRGGISSVHHGIDGIEYFLAKTELYESDPDIRKNERWLIGDEELMKQVKILEKVLLQKKIKVFPKDVVPKSIIKSLITEKDKKMILFAYIDLYKSNKLEEKDFLLFVWLFFFKYLKIEDFNHYPLSIRLKLQNFKKLHQEKSFDNLITEELKSIKEIILLL